MITSRNCPLSAAMIGTCGALALALSLALPAASAQAPVPAPASPLETVTAATAAAVTPEHTAQLVQIVRAAVTSYTLALEQLGVTRRQAIKIKLSNNASDYQIHAQGHVMTYTDREARWPNGLAYMDLDTLMIKALPPYDQAELQHRVWHELTHALQYDLSNGGSARARPWLSEGMADLFAFLAAGKADSASIAEWKGTLQRKLALAGATPLSAASLVELDAFDWDTLSDASQGANYALADLMVLQFYETRGAQAVPQLAAYYRCLVQGFAAEPSCFADKLGMRPAQFAQLLVSPAPAPLAAR